MGGLGERLRDAREHAGMTQAEAAERLGVSPGTVKNWENGHTDPRGKRAVIEAFIESAGRPEPTPPAGVLLDLPDEVLDGLTPLQREELVADLKAKAYAKAAEIRARRA